MVSSLCWRISEEDFVQIGDVDSSFQLYDESKRTAQEYFDNLKNKDTEEDVFVIDENAWNLFLTEKEQDEVLEHLKANDKKIYLI